MSTADLSIMVMYERVVDPLSNIPEKYFPQKWDILGIEVGSLVQGYSANDPCAQIVIPSFPLAKAGLINLMLESYVSDSLSSMFVIDHLSLSAEQLTAIEDTRQLVITLADADARNIIRPKINADEDDPSIFSLGPIIELST